jgi:hypothetical protein
VTFLAAFFAVFIGPGFMDFGSFGSQAMRPDYYLIVSLRINRMHWFTWAALYPLTNG